jgi:hypothetical protein
MDIKSGGPTMKHKETGMATMSPTSRRSPLPQEEITFGRALDVVVSGKRVTRIGWKEPMSHVLLVGGIVHLRKTDGTLHKLIVSDGDIIAKDWVIVREN